MPPRLETMLDPIPYDSLPPAWNTFDLAAFSRHKILWDYQQNALRNAIKTLWKYYAGEEDHALSLSQEAFELDDAARKTRLMDWYRHNGVSDNLDISLGRKRGVNDLLADYYPVVDGHIDYQHFINRMGFWMATGSGKTLVIVKLLEALWLLMQRGAIPVCDLLVLTHRDDLLAQLERHVEEFNRQGDLHIGLRELRDYAQVKRETPSLFRGRELTVFTYRSDNLSDEQKEKIVDFHNYDNNGRWYVLLDEAHKGDREESKRQHIYSILTRNGFLFNFSATFTDERDKVTTAYNFNLARFVQKGYGKHITILRQENRAFRDKQDYTGEEKRKVVLKALILLTYAHQLRANLAVPDLYHRPLMLTLVNSVNTKDADLKLFFRELARIGVGQLDDRLWTAAHGELREEIAADPKLMFETEHFGLDDGLYRALTLHDVRRHVFNADLPGEIEVLERPSNRQEVAFKLKSGDRPFALIKIGDVSGWLKDELTGYEVISGFDDESYFEELNGEGSSINILMGSRSFYEGWDSNRPNVITFINIGTGSEARKFILQSVGRGVRIEPLTNQRRRLQVLYNAGVADAQVFPQVRDRILPLETLAIFGTNRKALEIVIGELDSEDDKPDAETLLPIELNTEAIWEKTLLIPVYRQSDRRLIDEQRTAKFAIQPDEFVTLQTYAGHLADDRLLLARHRATPAQIGLFRRSLDDPQRFFTQSYDAPRYGRLDLLLPNLLTYFGLIPRQVDGLKRLDGEINHYQNITVTLDSIAGLLGKIDQVRSFSQRVVRERELRERMAQMSFEEIQSAFRSLDHLTADATFTHNGQELHIRHIANHYYLPLLYANQRLDYIRHIIQHESEVRFLNQLNDYLAQPDNAFAAYDWWLFSKLDETLDTVYIPYYDPKVNRMRQFNPDFIFWLKKGRDYRILFVDPKGMQNIDWVHKIAGYRKLFEDPDTGKPFVFQHDGLSVQVQCALYTPDANLAPQEYHRYWFDSPGQLIPTSASATPLSASPGRDPEDAGHRAQSE